MPNGEMQDNGAGIDRRLTAAHTSESGLVFLIKKRPVSAAPLVLISPYAFLLSLSLCTALSCFEDDPSGTDWSTDWAARWASCEMCRFVGVPRVTEQRLSSKSRCCSAMYALLQE